MFKWSPSCACCSTPVPTCQNCQTCSLPSTLTFSFDYPAMDFTYTAPYLRTSNLRAVTQHITLSYDSGLCLWTNIATISSAAVFGVPTSAGTTAGCTWYNNQGGSPSPPVSAYGLDDLYVEVGCYNGTASQAPSGYLRYKIYLNRTSGVYVPVLLTGLLAQSTCSPILFGPESSTSVSFTSTTGAYYLSYVTPGGSGTCYSSPGPIGSPWAGFVDNVSLTP